MKDHTMKKPIGILCYVLLNIASLIFPEDFVIIDCNIEFEVPILLGRPFLDASRDLFNIETRQIKLILNNEKFTFNVCHSMK